MKKALTVLIIAVFGFLIGFANFFPLDTLAGNFLLSKNVKFENIKGNLFTLSISDINIYGIKINSAKILNRLTSIKLKLERGEASFSLLNKNTNLKVNNEEFLIDRNDIKGLGSLSVNGNLNVENLKGNVKGKIILKELSYNGVRTKDVAVEINFKDGKISGKVNHSLIKGVINGILKTAKGKVSFKGSFKGTAFGSRIDERLSFETAI